MRPAHRRTRPVPRSVRVLAAAGLVGAGLTMIAMAQAWRGFEAILSAHAIHLVTGEATAANPVRHLLILYKGTSVQSTFVLTSECSVAYLLAGLLIGSAALMLLPQLAPRRTAAAVAVAAGVLVLVNVARLTAIGATVSEWGRDPGLTIAHTYLGSLLTVIGTGAAGIAFVAVLLRHSSARPRPIGES